MNFIFFATLCILGPELSSATTYLIVDEDTLRNLQLNSRVSRRNTLYDENFFLSKDYIKTALNFLKSYNEDDLNNAFQYFRNQLTDVNVADPTLNIAKNVILNKLDEIKGEPGKEIKKMIDILLQKLDKGDLVMRATDDDRVERLVSNFRDETIQQRSLSDGAIPLVDTINTAFNTFVGMLLNTNESNEKPGRTTGHREMDDLFVKLLKLFKAYKEKGSFNKKELDKLNDLYEEYVGAGRMSNRMPIGYFQRLFLEKENNGNADWETLIPKWMEEMDNTVSPNWVTDVFERIRAREESWKNKWMT